MTILFQNPTYKIALPQTDVLTYENFLSKSSLQNWIISNRRPNS